MGQTPPRPLGELATQVLITYNKASHTHQLLLDRLAKEEAGIPQDHGGARSRGSYRDGQGRLGYCRAAAVGRAC